MKHFNLRTGDEGDGNWQPVWGTSHKFYVYRYNDIFSEFFTLLVLLITFLLSAYCDDRDKPLVRIIAATKTKKSDKVRAREFSCKACSFYFSFLSGQFSTDLKRIC